MIQKANFVAKKVTQLAGAQRKSSSAVDKSLPKLIIGASLLLVALKRAEADSLPHVLQRIKRDVVSVTIVRDLHVCWLDSLVVTQQYLLLAVFVGNEGLHC